KGTTNITTTDDNGYFILKGATHNGTLVISGVTIQTYEIPVNGKDDLTTLVVKTKVAVGEVVTVISTGYQTISRERSAGAFAKPDMNTVRQRSTSMNILQRLDGLVPGLMVNLSPSSSQNPLLVRGVTSINGVRAPLFVVDGIQVNDVTAINPDDVADITVLKDATAASIWGARASNGVIVISTKKGGKSDKLRVDYDGFLNFQGKPDISYFPVLSSKEFIQAAKEIFAPTQVLWTSVIPATADPHDQILYDQYRGLISAATANAKLDSLSNINNVQQIKDLWYRNAMLTNHTVSVQGGGNVYSFYGSLGYTNTRNATPGSSDQTFRINLRQDFRFSNAIQCYLITNLTNNITSSKRYVAPDDRFIPYQLFRDASGNNLDFNPFYRIDSMRLVYQGKSGIDLSYNPLNETNYGDTKTDAFQTRLVGGATIRLFKGLRFEGVYGLIKNNNKITAYDDALSYTVRNEAATFTLPSTTGGLPTYYLPVSGGKYVVTNSNDRNWTVRNQLVFDTAWAGKKHQVTLLAGQEAQNQLTNTVVTTQRGYNRQLLTFASIDYNYLLITGVSPNTFGNRATLVNDAWKETENETRFTSWYGNAAYTYNRRYTINGSVRADQSNLFGKDKSAQNRPVWSAGAAWLV
ncbi:MAG TPA: TonB-dependent receptor plug domain-containing protein, partial [Chitinophagaceae bacterium]|nr:TonB-dependent receptor plug domain-containing protein [Chitinophagaceae bacterium]